MAFVTKTHVIGRYRDRREISLKLQRTSLLFKARLGYKAMMHKSAIAKVAISTQHKADDFAGATPGVFE